MLQKREQAPKCGSNEERRKKIAKTAMSGGEGRLIMRTSIPPLAPLLQAMMTH
jgi:hypothetical protein